ncbi:unnamed protein product [Prorocentrum cordatum]|uniref:Uncharacterized protein n=1 Tax=Prorocentrum cordatum TaxID=2364126 RepID=A0ABN9Y287_9DINO|nr:unnamed protein product [Polarella glacialis]
MARTRARPWAAQWRRLRAQHGALLARVAVLVAGEAAVEGWRSARRSGPTTSRTSTRSSTEYGGPDVGGVHPPATGAGSDGIDRRFKDGSTMLHCSPIILLHPALPPSWPGHTAPADWTALRSAAAVWKSM